MKRQDNATLLILRHRKGGTVIDEVFRVESEEITIVVDGHTILRITNGRVFVDASKGDVRSVEIRSIATPSPSPVSTLVPFTDPLTVDQHMSGWPPAPFYPKPGEDTGSGVYCRFEKDGLHVGPGDYNLEGWCRNQNLNLGNATISVVAQLVEDDRKGRSEHLAYDSGFGLVVRIPNDGRASQPIGFRIRADGTWTDLTAQEDRPVNRAIRRGSRANNKLGVKMHGTRFEFLVNDTPIAVHDVADLADKGLLAPSGGIALVADEYDAVVFSNLVVQNI